MSSAATALAPHPFAEAVRKAIGEVFTNNFGADWTVEISQQPQTNEETAAVWFGISVSGDIQGEAAIQLSLHDATLLARKFVAAPERPSTDFTDGDRNVVRGILQQVLEAAAVILKNRFGVTTLKVAAIEPPTWPGVAVALSVSGALWKASSLQLRLGSDLLDAMTSKSTPANVSSAPVKAAALPSNPAPLGAHVAVSQDAPDPLRGVDLKEGSPAISDIDLEVLRKADLKLRIRFGTRVLSLKDVLALSSGSVVELDREVEEPADLMLGERVVGRGEVVIVDGNYGVRVTEVAGPRTDTEARSQPGA